MQPSRQFSGIFIAIIIAALIVSICVVYSFFSKNSSPEISAKPDIASSNSVELKESQLGAIKIEPAGTYHFLDEKKAVGSIAYHEQDEAHLPWLPNNAHATNPTPNSATKLIVASVSENDSPLIHLGQLVKARVDAYPDRAFEGKVLALGGTIWDSGGNPAIDPVTRRIAVRCEISDPKNELYPGMFANIAIQIQEPVDSVSVPANGVVRKGDGTMTVWVTRDRKRFEERTVNVGLQQDGFDQILDGLKTGEQVVTDGAVFISNILYAPPSD